MIAPAAVSPTVVVTAFPSPPAVSSNTFSLNPMNAPTANPTAAPTSVSRAMGHRRRDDWADAGAAVATMTASTTIVCRMPVSLFVTGSRPVTYYGLRERRGARLEELGTAGQTRCHT
jgi:hypothetical protein